MNPDRDAALAAALRSVQARAPWVTADAFAQLTSGAECIPVTVDGEVVGAVLVIGSEVHACIEDRGHGRWFGKWALRLLDRIQREHGRATTRVMATSAPGLEFVKRLGFRQVGANGETLAFERP